MRIGELFGGASRYAHLAGLVPARGRRAEEDDKEPKDAKTSRRAADDDEDDEPKGKKSRAEDDPSQYPDDDDSKPSGKKSRAEEGDDDDEPKGKKSKAAEGDEDDDEPKGKRSKARADADEDDCEDDDDKDEMSGKSAAASARRRERARCKAIFSHPAAATNLALAASLAFDTTQTRKEALAVLKSQAGRSSGAHDVRVDRARGNPDLGAGGDPQPTGAKAAQASWARALDKAGARKRD